MQLKDDRTLAARQLFSCYPRFFVLTLISWSIYYMLSGLSLSLPSFTSVFFPTTAPLTSRRVGADSIPWLVLF